GGPEPKAVIEQRLLKTEVISQALLGLQIAVGEKAERWKINESLRKARSLERGSNAGLQFCVGPRKNEGRRHTPCRMLPEILIVVEANVCGQIEAPRNFGL